MLDCRAGAVAYILSGTEHAGLHVKLEYDATQTQCDTATRANNIPWHFDWHITLVCSAILRLILKQQ